MCFSQLQTAGSSKRSHREWVSWRFSLRVSSCTEPTGHFCNTVAVLLSSSIVCRWSLCHLFIYFYGRLLSFISIHLLIWINLILTSGRVIIQRRQLGVSNDQFCSFVLGPHLMVLSAYSWLCAPGSLLAGLGNHVGCWGLHAKQAHSPLDHLPASWWWTNFILVSEDLCKFLATRFRISIPLNKITCFRNPLWYY